MTPNLPTNSFQKAAVPLVFSGTLGKLLLQQQIEAIKAIAWNKTTRSHECLNPPPQQHKGNLAGNATRFPVRAVGADTKAAPSKSATPLKVTKEHFVPAEATVARDAEAILSTSTSTLTTKQWTRFVKIRQASLTKSSKPYQRLKAQTA